MNPSGPRTVHAEKRDNMVIFNIYEVFRAYDIVYNDVISQKTLRLAKKELDFLTAHSGNNAELLEALENIVNRFDKETYANIKAAVLDARAVMANATEYLRPARIK